MQAKIQSYQFTETIVYFRNDCVLLKSVNLNKDTCLREIDSCEVTQNNARQKITSHSP